MAEGIVSYTSTTYGKWSLPTGAVRLIGEYTNENGPSIEDWFVCFVSGPSECFEAPVSADGLHECLDALGDQFGNELELKLASSTSFNSRIIWPKGPAGKPLFKFREAAETSRWQMVCNNLLGHRVEQVLSEVALEFLESEDT